MEIAKDREHANLVTSGEIFMSNLFGPIVQQGYVVPDLDATMAHWLARGIGPFLVFPDHQLETEK
jgi:hypothetical protein